MDYTFIVLFSFLLMIILMFMIIFISRYSYAISKTTMLLGTPAYPSDLIQSILKNGMTPTLNKAVPREGGYLLLRLPMDDLKLPTIVTSRLLEFPPDQFHKKGAVPQLLIDVAKLDPEGTSVFLKNLDERGPHNQRKVAYMNAMTPSHLAKYRMTIHRVLRDNSNTSCTLLDRIMTITWEIHFGKKPCPYAIFFMNSFRKAFSDISLVGIWTCRQDYIREKPAFTKFLLQLVKEAPNETMVGAWKHDGVLTNHDIVVEISHNILAMTMQWFLLSRSALQDRELAHRDPSTFFNKYGFAPSISSLNNQGNRVVAQIVPSVPGVCPYMASSRKNPKTCPMNRDLDVMETGEIIPSGANINIAPEFLAFGKGYRRCAGEVLTHIYLEELLSCRKPFHDPDLGNVKWGFTRTR